MRWIDRAGRRVSLRHLHIFMAVADCGSIAKAAALLSISHPVVSKTISDLAVCGKTKRLSHLSACKARSCGMIFDWCVADDA